MQCLKIRLEFNVAEAKARGLSADPNEEKLLKNLGENTDSDMF